MIRISSSFTITASSDSLRIGAAYDALCFYGKKIRADRTAIVLFK
jgi:hypothetical protein